ncbi:WXG100-like domain-containing protein [Actinoallomurus acanthiterrae]
MGEFDALPEIVQKGLFFLEMLVGGCQWPDGSMGGLARMQSALTTCADAFGEGAKELDTHAGVVVNANAGDATDKFKTFAQALSGGGEAGGLRFLEQSLRDLASWVDGLAAQKRAARLQFEISCAFVVITMAIGFAWSFITAGASEAAAIGASEAEGFALKAFLQRIALWMGRHQIMTAAGVGAWFGGGMDAAGQYARIHEGVQKGWNWGEFGKSVGMGAIAGGVMGGLGRAVPALAEHGSPVATKLADWMGAPGMKGVAARFGFAGTTGTVGNVAGQVVFDRDHINVGQAAAFGFGMAGLGGAKEAGQYAAGRFRNGGEPTTGGGDDGAPPPPPSGGSSDGKSPHGDDGQPPPPPGGSPSGGSGNHSDPGPSSAGQTIPGEVLNGHDTSTGGGDNSQGGTSGHQTQGTNLSGLAAGDGRPAESPGATTAPPASQPLSAGPGDGGVGAGAAQGPDGPSTVAIQPGAPGARAALPPRPGEPVVRGSGPAEPSAGGTGRRDIGSLLNGDGSERPRPANAGTGTSGRETTELDRLLNHSPERTEDGAADPSQPAPGSTPDGPATHAEPGEGRPTESGPPLEPESYGDTARTITQQVGQLDAGSSHPTASAVPDSPAAQTTHPAGTPGRETTATPHSEVTAQVDRLAASLRRDVGALEDRVAAHEAQAREAGARAEAALNESLTALAEGGPGAREHSDRALAESRAALRDQARHTDDAASCRKALEKAREAQIGYDALRNSLEHLTTTEHPSEFEAQVSADAARTLAENAQQRLTAYDDARSEAPAPHPSQSTDHGARGDATALEGTRLPGEPAEAGRNEPSGTSPTSHADPSKPVEEPHSESTSAPPTESTGAPRSESTAQPRTESTGAPRTESAGKPRTEAEGRSPVPHGEAEEPAGESPVTHPDTSEPTGESSGHDGPSEPTAPRTESGGEEPAPEPPPEIHPPRYTDYGALGDGTAVEGARLPTDPAEAARQWAACLPEHLPAKLRAEVEAYVRDILSDPNPDRWTDLLQDGIAFESRGHVVWIKPKLDTYTHVETPEGPRRYTVSFGGSGAGAKESGRVHRDESGGVVEMLDNSDGLERVSLPGPSVGKVSGHAHGSSTEVMAGHKSVAFKHDFFDWTVRLEAHVNGGEPGYGGVVHDLSLSVPFPEQFHREGPHVDPGDRPPAPRHRVTSDRAPEVRKHDVVVTAVQRDQLVTEFQRRALQAGVSPKRIAEIVNRDINGHLGQQVLLNRSRDLLNGELTTPDTTVTSRVLRLERLPESDTPIRDAVLRDDQGLLTTTNDAHQFGHKWGVNFGLKLGMDNPAAKFFARIGGNYQGGKNHVVSYSHTTLPKITLVRKAEVARYNAIVRMEVETRFGSFPVDVPMELAVRASDAPQFETDLLGGVKTEGLLPPGSGEHAIDPPSQEPSPTGDPAAAPGHGLPAHAEKSVPVAPHEPHPAEPAHLAAGRGAGMGKLTGLPGADRVVTDLRAAIDQALPDLPESVRRQLAQNLDARFGRSALEGRSLADLLHGDTHTITVGKHTIEIAHRAQLGERRNVEEFDMTVNDRKVAGSGTAVGQNRHSGGGAEVAGNVRVQTGKVGVDAPKVALHAGGSKSKSVTFLGGSTEYRRTETDGPVTQVTKEMRHHVRMRVHDGRKELTDQSWAVSGDDVSARVVVPQEHTPAARVTPDEVAKVGQVDRVDTLPDDHIDFAGQTTAVFPSFSASHDLPFEVARVEAEANGRSAPTDLLDVPPEILDATRPSTLEAHFAELTSRDGWRIQVTQPDGSRHGMTLRATFGMPEHATARTGIEIEHYRAANSRMKDAASTDLRAEGELKVGIRGKLTVGGVEVKGVGEVGGMAEVDRRTGSSEYTGASDVIRGTYSSDGLTHSFSGSDLHLSVTPDAPAGHHPKTSYLLVHDGADFMMPDRIAQDHHLDHLATAPDVHGQDGEPVVPKPVGEPRTYRPDLAITSAHVEHFDGQAVLPKIVDMLDARDRLPKSGPAREAALETLREAFGEPALAANMPNLRRGVVQWLPIESGFGFTLHEGIRVRAELEGGAHTAERPDVSHMARVQGLSGSETSHGHGSGYGGKGLVRGMAEGERGSSGGGQIGGGRVHRSETEHSDGTGEKDIDRRQTREGSQEFTHGLRYEIEGVETKDPPHGLEHGINAIRRGADTVARLTGNDAAARYFDRVRSAKTETETATVGGGVRLVIPHHLTTVAGEGEHVPGWAPVRSEFARWQTHTAPTEVNGTLGDMVGRISFPGAEVVHEFAPLAALPPERRGPTPAETDRPSEFELSRPQGMRLWKQTEPATMLSQVKSLLDHSYTVDGLRPGEKITVGMNVTSLKEDAQALLKRREYSQTATNQRDGGVHGTDSSVRGGGSGGTSGGHGLMVSHGQGKGSAVAHEADSVNIRERNIEVTDQNIMYGADVVLVFHREGAPDLLVDVSDALHIRLTADDAAALERQHPGLIRRPAGIESRTAEAPGNPLSSLLNPETEPAQQRRGD